ncbi:MAG: hypothetical protein CVU13_03565 [Bacteroidetes bacterium HGW-Bacteroidetes-8]|jgi:AraC-like DNA-binding protein|nr:MAG: hypothetical protein CVU13_03565 [Bacteroidetes bacterium HGW-Bacteroidetes-8]
MNNFFIFGEIFLRVGSLMLLIYLVLSAYLFYIANQNREISDDDKIRLKTLSAGFAGISLMILFKQIFPQVTEYSDICGVKCILAGNIVQLFLPVQLYFLQKNYRLPFGLIGGVIVIGAVLTINLFLVILFSYYKIEDFQFLIYLFLLLLGISTAVQIYRLIKVRPISKLATLNESSNNMGELVIFFSASALSFIVLIMISFDANPLSREGVKFILSALNIFLFVKVIYPYSKFFSRVNFIGRGAQLRAVTITAKRFSDEKKSQELRGRLVSYFENEKPYLRPDLTIQEVALYLYSNKTYLSRIINECFDNNFNQFVNYHRVEEAKRLFYNDPRMSIQQMCDLSGFGSMATFCIAFRFFVGNSPADWCKEQKIKGFNDKKGKD